MPSPTESAPWGSKSTSSTFSPYSQSAAPRLMVVVVLPTPPFWLTIATTRAGPCVSRGGGSGKTGRGRLVGPRFKPVAGVAVLVSPQGFSGVPGVEPLVVTVTSSNLPDDLEPDRPDGHYGVSTRAARHRAQAPRDSTRRTAL